MATIVLLCALAVLAGKRRRVVNEKTCVASGRRARHFSPRKTLVLCNGGVGCGNGRDSSFTITPLNNNKKIVRASERRTREKERNCRRKLTCIVRAVHPLRISYYVYIITLLLSTIVR